MNLLVVIGIIGVIGGLLPLVMTIVNLRLCKRPATDAAWDENPPRVVVCIPARNEASNIEACVRSVLQDGDRHARAVVYDDQSDDGTGEIVEMLAREDDRVRTAPTQTLPAGWNGKQHACWRMARAAIDGELGEDGLRDDDVLLFTDADVRFEPGALRGAASEMRRLDAALVSCFPRQITGTLIEAVVVPMMFYLLYGYLPMARMRATTDPSTSAGCGQFLMITAAAYEASGGHAGFKDSMHDGIKLPRAVRRAGLKTDLFDGSGTASVRMYRGFTETWRGFVKNAYEGLGSIGLLIFLTVLHAAGHVGPWLALAWLAFFAPSGGGLGAFPVAASLCVIAILAQLCQRLLLATRLRHSVTGALLHPLGVAMMTLIQWASYVGHVRGVRAWRGRTTHKSSPTSAFGTLD